MSNGNWACLLTPVYLQSVSPCSFTKANLRSAHAKSAPRGVAARGISNVAKMSSPIPWSSVMTSKDSYTCVPSEGFMHKQSMKPPKKKSSDQSRPRDGQTNDPTAAAAERNGTLDREQEIADAASR